MPYFGFSSGSNRQIKNATVDFFPKTMENMLCGNLYNVHFGYEFVTQSKEKPQSTSPPYCYINDPTIYNTGGPLERKANIMEWFSKLPEEEKKKVRKESPMMFDSDPELYIIGRNDGGLRNPFKFYNKIPIYCMPLMTAYKHMEKTLSKNGILFIKYDPNDYNGLGFFDKLKFKFQGDPSNDTYAIILFYLNGSLYCNFLNSSHLKKYNEHQQYNASTYRQKGKDPYIDLANIIVESYNKDPRGSSGYDFGIDAALVDMAFYSNKKGIVGLKDMPGFPSTESIKGGRRSANRHRSSRKKTLKKKKGRSTRHRLHSS